LPVPQLAASAAAVGVNSTAPIAIALNRHRKLILKNVGGNGGQNKAQAKRWSTFEI
jgi:hypothetical protein